MRVLLGLAVLLLSLAPALAEPLEPSRVRVIDGDTIAIGKTVYRLIGFDAPETGERASCRAEADLGARATNRLRTIVFQGSLDLKPVACACRPGTEGSYECNYGRVCAVLASNGRDVAAIMVGEGLAHEYVCVGHHCPRRGGWCQPTG